MRKQADILGYVCRCGLRPWIRQSEKRESGLLGALRWMVACWLVACWLVGGGGGVGLCSALLECYVLFRGPKATILIDVDVNP